MFDQRIKWTKDGKYGTKQPTLCLHIVITGVSLVVIGLFAYGQYCYAGKKAEQWLTETTQYDTQIKSFFIDEFIHYTTSVSF